jgi:hypothetical protein
MAGYKTGLERNRNDKLVTTLPELSANFNRSVNNHNRAPAHLPAAQPLVLDARQQIRKALVEPLSVVPPLSLLGVRLNVLGVAHSLVHLCEW